MTPEEILSIDPDQDQVVATVEQPTQYNDDVVHYLSSIDLTLKYILVFMILVVGVWTAWWVVDDIVLKHT